MNPRQQFSENNIPVCFKFSFATQLSSPIIEGPIHKSAVDREKQKERDRAEIEVEKLAERGDQAQLSIDGKLARHDSLKASVSDFIAQASLQRKS